MLVGGRPQVLWEGLAELRADAPSKARGAEGERGRPPPSSNTQRPITPESRKEPPPQKKDSGHAKAGPDAPTRPTTRRLKHHVCAYSPTFRLCSNERQPKNQHNLTYKPQIGL